MVQPRELDSRNQTVSGGQTTGNAATIRRPWSKQSPIYPLALFCAMRFNFLVVATPDIAMRADPLLEYGGA
jgi:hypothetical protein